MVKKCVGGWTPLGSLQRLPRPLSWIKSEERGMENEMREWEEGREKGGKGKVKMGQMWGRGMGGEGKGKDGKGGRDGVAPASADRSAISAENCSTGCLSNFMELYVFEQTKTCILLVVSPKNIPIQAIATVCSSVTCAENATVRVYIVDWPM